MHFGLLGPLTVSDGPREVAVSAPRQRVLLAALLLNAGRVVSLDALGEMLWEGESPAGSRGALHSAVQRLRSTLGPPGADLVETRPPGYLIKVGDDDLDVRQFGMLAARGHAAAEAGAWAQAAGLLREALGLWRGEPLADVPSQLLRDREVPALEDQRLQALAVRIDADLHLGLARRRHRRTTPAGRGAPVAGAVPRAADAEPVPRRAAGRRPRRLPARAARRDRGAGHRAQSRAQAPAPAHPHRRR